MKWLILGLFAVLLAGGTPAVAQTPAPDPQAPTLLPTKPPALPSRHDARLIGEYGAPDDLLVIYERDNWLFAARGDEKAIVLNPSADGAYGGKIGWLVFEGRTGRAPAVALDGRRLPRRDIGAEVEAKIRAGVRADAGALRAAALAAQPPAETNRPRQPDLVSLRSVDRSIRFDIRYATANNFMGIPLYERADAYLQRPAADALGRVQRSLRAKGYGLLVHDAYRPWFVTRMFWDATPAEGKAFVADPAQGSRHNRGAAVDLTLYELGTRKAVEMPGRYDEFSRRSYPDYPGGTSRQRWLRDLMRREMEREGFSVYPEEWWHFDYKDWALYPIGNLTFTQLALKRDRVR